MNFDLEGMKAKVLLIADPNSNYTQEDFNKEFGGVNYTTNNDLYKIKLEFVNKSNNPDPEYIKSGDSGFDLRANLSEPLIIASGEYCLIKTGLYFELPINMELQIRSRSGLAFKHGISVLNGIGTIDNNYRGEIGILLINHGKNNFIVNNGDRIAQGVIVPVISKSVINFIKVNVVSNNTERSVNGYGSTGIS